MKSEDIARLAGVSRSTVSRVINNYTNVPPETKEKVMKVIEEYNYRPNTYARTLAGKRSNTIGLFFLVTGETYENGRIARNDYFSSYLSYLVDLANASGYYVLVTTISSEADFDKVNQTFLEKRIDGGILIGTQDDTLEKMVLGSMKAPLVVFDYDADRLSDSTYPIHVINANDGLGIHSAMTYLLEQGHEHIGFIKGNMATRSARVRFDGYLKALEAHGLTYEEDFVIEGEFSSKVAYKNTKEMLMGGYKPTAIICSNDYMAIEAMKAAREMDISIPEEMAFVGFDNVHMAEQAMVPLTTLEPDFYGMSKKAVAYLDKAIQEEEPEQVSLGLFDVKLIKRKSS